VKVAIIGAGAAGLGAARVLRGSRHQATVFEREHRVGGRLLTFEQDGFIFDMGATAIAPRGKALAPVMLNELDRSGLEVVSLPIYIHQFGRVTSGRLHSDQIERYCYRLGNEQLARLLAEGLDVRLGVGEVRLERASSGYVVAGEAYDAVFLACPTPVATELLAQIGEARALQNARYRPCLSVALGFAAPLPRASYHAVIDPEQRSPLTWLSLESNKCSGRAPAGHTAMVAQLGPFYSREHFTSSEGEIVATSCDLVRRIYGDSFSAPIVHHVVRWKYSQPESTAWFESVNRRGATLLVIGDGVIGGRVELAYESGVRAATQFLEDHP
jgi:predicted NAD/FAD-dependent oxidoreductase